MFDRHMILVRTAWGVAKVNATAVLTQRVSRGDVCMHTISAGSMLVVGPYAFTEFIANASFSL